MFFYTYSFELLWSAYRFPFLSKQFSFFSLPQPYKNYLCIFMITLLGILENDRKKIIVTHKELILWEFFFLQMIYAYLITQSQYCGSLGFAFIGMSK